MGGSVMFTCTATLPLDNKPLKKVNLVCESKSDTVLPKTMEHSAYVPRVENISPALSSDDAKDDVTLQATKDGLLNQITNIDKKIAQTEEEIKHLGKKMQELQEAADISKGASKEEDDKKLQSPTLAIKIYTENKRKRQEGKKIWDKLGPKLDMPLYNQPSDTAIYHENRRKHLVFRYCLLKFLKCKQVETSAKENYLIALYMEKKQDWLNKVKAIESSLAHKKKEAEKKIIFEKEFPRLRKQIEEKRKQRLSQIESHFGTADRSKSTCAIVCPILLPSRVQEYKYINDNGLVKDLPVEYKEWQLINMWTDTEKAIFKEKFLQHPKQFGVIASYLDHKSICECVKYYYLSKQTENYKSLLRKSRKRAHLNYNGLPAKRATTTQLNFGKVSCLQTGKESREDLHASTVSASNATVHGVQGSLVIQGVQQSSLVDSMNSKSTAPVPSPVSKSGTKALIADSELESVDLLHDQGSKKLESTRSTLENAEHQSSQSTQSMTECEAENHKEDKRVVPEAIKSEASKNFDKCDLQKGIVQSIMLDHSKQLPHTDVSQYSMCEEQALHGGQVPSTCKCKFRGGCYTHCQVLMYQCSQSQAHHCSTQWTDVQQQAVINGEDKVLQPNVDSNSGSISMFRGSYGATSLGNVVSNSIKSDNNIAKDTSQANVRGVEDHSVLTKSCDIHYREMVIKATGRCAENPSTVEVSLPNKPLGIDIGVRQPLTLVSGEDLVGVPEREDVSKQVHSVKDLLMEVIEKQIMKNFDGCDEVGISSVEGKGPLTPTLSSILQTHRITGRSHSNFVSGIQSGDDSRNLHLSGNLLVPTSEKQMVPLDQKQHALQMTAYHPIPNSRGASHEYLPERKEGKIPCSRNFQDGIDRKHCFQDDSVIASHHRPSPLLPTPLHHTHYPLASMPHVAVHTTPRSSVAYLSRGNVAANQIQHHQSTVQDSEGTLDLSTKKFRAYNSPGLSCEGFSRQQTSQNQPMYHLSPRLPHYLSRPAVPAAQHKVHPQEFAPTVSSPSALVHGNRYGSVISQSVGREQVHDFTAPANMLDGRITNVSPGCTSNVSPRAYTPQVKAMINMYKPYFP